LLPLWSWKTVPEMFESGTVASAAAVKSEKLAEGTSETSTEKRFDRSGSRG